MIIFRGSLRNKLITFVMIATILPMSTFLLVSHLFTKDKLSEKAIKDSASLIYQGKENISNYIMSIYQTTNVIYHNDTLMDILKNKVHDYFDDSRIFLTEQEIIRNIYSIGYALADGRQIYLYLQQSNRAYLISDGRLVRSDKGIYPYRSELRKGESKVIPPHAMNSYGMNMFTYSDSLVLTFEHSLYDIASKTELGSLSIDVKLDRIRSICNQLHTINEEELFVIDNQGMALFASDNAMMGNKLDHDWNKQLLEETRLHSSGSFRMNDPNFSGIYIYDTIETPYGDWTIVKRIPDSFLFQHDRQVTQINLYIGIAFVCAAILVAVYLSIKLTSPIGELISYINQIERGNMNVEIKVAGNDELSSLARRFKSMMHTINELFMREYKLELANKTNELKALQAQVNPHFLNNSLQSIGSLALQQGNQQVYSLITSLGKMMRYSMNMDETIVSLKEEMDYVTTYLKLQKIRFREQYEQDIEWDPNIESILVPKMIVQPIVENYFKHGFMGVEGNNLIRIRCYEDEMYQMLVIEVVDNGYGIEEAELQQLRRQLSNSQAVMGETTGHIGLVNVYSRLKLYYGDRATMTIEQNEPRGFKVVLHIPILQNKGEVTIENTHY
ncbi:sensor histidine kinase [Paenibacillus albiflavus]|uniref:Sensor histidine kinase n=1 Tax=Paenibacillus albiflavus TaxID=2545760 RepID=A0A4R4ECI5_9BACL|nr:sensor histidine kinase [Paenibacillus albiflavus]TCZ77399.1 sensor histidine kinase [Paenibacillus albiflavus]